MPIAQVLDPDGKTIHEFEVPEGAKPADVEAFASSVLGKQSPSKEAPKQDTPKMQVDPVTTGMASAIDAVPFGADIAASYDALTNNGGGSFGDRQKAAKALLNEGLKAGQEQNPKAAIAGTLVGAASTIPLIPAKALQGASVAMRALKGAGVGAALTGLHGAGEGDTLGERASNAATGATVGSLFGAGGSVLADGLALGARQVATPLYNLAQRAKALVKNNFAGEQGSEAGLAAANQTQQGMRSSGDIGLGDVRQSLNGADTSGIGNTTSDIIPLTVGQATQDPAKQALEAGAAAGIHGDEARNLMNEVRTLQSDKAKQVISKIAGGELNPDASPDAAASIVSTLRSAYQAAKDKTSAAYKTVGDLSGDNPVMIAGDYVKNTVIPSFKNFAEKGYTGTPFDLKARGMEEANRLYQKGIGLMKQADASGGKSASTITDQYGKPLSEALPPSLTKNFFEMENYRSSLSQGIQNAQTPTEKAFLTGLLKRYDTAMDQLPREAVKSGDVKILDAMEKARASRAEQGRLFERSDLVKDVVQNENLTNEQFANSINSLGVKSGAYVKDILKAASNNPELQAQLQTQVKQAVLGSIVNKSLTAEVKAGGDVAGGVENMISFDKLATNLQKLTQNKTLFENVVPDVAERKAIEQAYNAARLIKSMKPGTRNYSNSAYTLLNVIRSIAPSVASTEVLGVGVGKILKDTAQTAALNEVKQSVGNVIKDIVANNNAITNFGEKYGRQIMAAGSGAAGQKQTDNILRVTVTPNDKNKLRYQE